MGVISSLDSAREAVGQCMDAVPVSARVLRFGAAALAGFAGVALVRSLFSSRRSAAPAVASTTPMVPQRHLARYLLAESVVSLLLPFCRRALLGDLPADSRIAALLDNFLRKDAER